jgi:microcystin-dependent protein
MAQPYVGEIRMFAGNFAPQGWMFCEGQLLPIAEYETLFNLIGTTYGGDGQMTFGLPDLRGRAPLHMGPGFTQGQAAGVEIVTLSLSQIPSHQHTPQAAGSGDANGPLGRVWAGSADLAQFTAPGAINTTMSAAALAAAGGSQPHDNMPPFLTVSFIISLFGIYPSPS